MRKKIIIEDNFADDFKAGHCYDCPFLDQIWYDDDGYAEYYDRCFMGYDDNKCKLKVEEG